MRRFLHALGLALLAASAATAQEVPKAEVFGGYSYAGEGTHGWNASAARNLNGWLGLAADAGGQYTRLEEPGFRERIKTHSFLFGPQLSVRRHKRLTPFVRTLFGASHVSTEAVEAGQRFSFSDTSFAAALGGGLDIKLSERLALRAFQADYVHTRFFGETQHKGRLSFGLVLRLGKKQ
jgi:opacity protein-like surface antigen